MAKPFFSIGGCTPVVFLNSNGNIKIGFWKILDIFILFLQNVRLGMHNRAPAVTFKRQSLENWMEIFAQKDWQNTFSKDEIREGMRFLERCPIREIEIRSDDVIVRYFGEGKTQLFAVIDLEEGQLSARSSVADKNDAAIGALLAMDEAIIDKQDALFLHDEEDGDTLHRCPPCNGKECDENKLGDKILHLLFYTSGQHLCFRAYWMENHRLVFPNHLSRYANVATKLERDAVIKLIHLARKSGFSFYKKSKEYRISHTASAIDFCRYTLPRWHNDFSIQLDGNVEKLCQGPREIHAIFRSGVENGNGFSDLSLQLSDGTHILEQHFIPKILKSDGNPFLIDGLGAVRMGKKEITAVAAQRSVLNKFNGHIPRYMIYSIFNLSELNYGNDPSMEEWQRSFTSPPNQSLTLPQILRSYQREGVFWINHILRHGFHGLIADDMGLGKTLQVLTFIAKMNGGQSSIVVCPASVVYVWQREAEKFFPKLKLRIFSSASNLDEKGIDIWVISYTQLRRHKAKIAEKTFQLAVLDEAQFIKNSATKVFYACTAIRSQWRLALTGTPIENNLLDLWSIFRFLMPGLLGEKGQFIELCKGEEIGARLKKQIAPFMLRRTKEMVAKELPQKIEINVPCEMTSIQQNLYKSVMNHALRRYGDEQHHFDFKNHRFGILSALTRLRQVACDPAIVPSVETPFWESGKLGTLRDILVSEFSKGQKKVVIFSQFVRFLRRIKSMLREEFPTVDCFEIIGSTKNRNVVVDQFQCVGNSAIMLISLKAGGVGITLTAAESVFLMDPWWNPSTEKQAMDRVHRIGQDKKVTIYRLIAQNSIEASIQRLQEKKTSLFSEIIDSLQVKQRGTEFFLQHIHELLKTE
ncbi:MAG: DEAD/DEAH box helicase [Puniceicoccales bacterium]|jgi:superfamily II DNA or RNA helicase|nr:DEAD/DEAH box helicase [Puniceicoccales bacterium]